jgi:hypothetical protein
MTRTTLLIAALSTVLSTTPLTAQQPAGDSQPFITRTLAAGLGSAAGFIAAGYPAFAIKGGPDGCDFCWEVQAAALAGSVFGAAGGAALAGGDFKQGLLGAALGTVAGSLVLAMLDQAGDPSEATFVISYALTQSLVTGYFSGR